MRWLLLLMLPLASAEEMIPLKQARICAYNGALVQGMMTKVNTFPSREAFMRAVIAEGGTSPRIEPLARVVWINRADPNYTQKFIDHCLSL